MKKKIVFLTICCLSFCLMAACSNKKPVNTDVTTSSEDVSEEGSEAGSEEVSDDIDFENMSDSEYEEFLLNGTIRDQIIQNSPNLVQNITDIISEDSFVTLKGIVTNADGEEENFSTEARKVSDLKSLTKLHDELIKHKVGDTFDTFLETASGELPVKITVVTVTDDPLNYLTDEWVQEYSGYDEFETVDEYKSYVQELIHEMLN